MELIFATFRSDFDQLISCAAARKGPHASVLEGNRMTLSEDICRDINPSF